MKIFIVLVCFIYHSEFVKFANGAYCCKGIVYDGRICYWLTILKGTAEEVNSECVENFGNLASFASQEVVNFLNSDYHSVLSKKQTAFIGANDRIQPNVFTERNGEPLAWTNWKIGEPKQRNGSGCAVVDFLQESQPPYQWFSVKCSDVLHHGLCSKDIQANDLRPCKGVCLSDSCYWLTDTEGGTSFLNSNCEQDEGILATIPSQDVNKELEEYYGHVLSKHNEIYIGLKRAANGEWTTWESEALTWTQWKQGLSMDDESKTCARILPFATPVYAWENHPCQESSYRGLCYRRNWTSSDNLTETSNYTTENSTYTSQSETTTSSLSKSITTTPFKGQSSTLSVNSSKSSTTSLQSSSSTLSVSSSTPTLYKDMTFNNSGISTFNVSTGTSRSTTTSSPGQFMSLNISTFSTSNVSLDNVICRCGLKYFFVNTSVSSTVLDISSNLTLDRKSLGLYRRRLISAKDDRPSARTVGSVGVIVIILEISLFFLLDLPFYIKLFSKFLKYCKRR